MYRVVSASIASSIKRRVEAVKNSIPVSPRYFNLWGYVRMMESLGLPRLRSVEAIALVYYWLCCASINEAKAKIVWKIFRIHAIFRDHVSILLSSRSWLSYIAPTIPFSDTVRNQY